MINIWHIWFEVGNSLSHWVAFYCFKNNKCSNNLHKHIKTSASEFVYNTLCDCNYYYFRRSRDLIGHNIINVRLTSSNHFEVWTQNGVYNGNIIEISL